MQVDNDSDNDNENILFDYKCTHSTIQNKISLFLYKLQNGLETILKGKYFVAFIIAILRNVVVIK